MSPRRRDLSGGLTRSALQLLALGLLIAGSLWILRPFLIAGLWATMLSVALWPLLLRAHDAFGGRRAPAVTLLTGVLLLIVVLPLFFGVSALAANAEDLAGWVQSVRFWTLPHPPEWVEHLPLVGANVAAQWRDLAEAGPQQLAERLGPQLRVLARWVVREMGGLGALVLQFLLTTIFAAILFARGERAASALRRFARRLAGVQGERAALLAAQAIRAVALGVVLTAIVQSVLVGVGFAVVGVPFAGILTALSFMLSVAQIGPLPLLIGAVIWVFAEQGVVWGSAYLVWAFLCGTIDNVMRPVLIKRGADLPLLLIFAGVIGGLLAFGIIGLFIGPVVLAVGYMLLIDWMEEAREPAPSVGAQRMSPANPAGPAREDDTDAAQPGWH
jgi:predicted PurR-regulated permease PerM